MAQGLGVHRHRCCPLALPRMQACQEWWLREYSSFTKNEAVPVAVSIRHPAKFSEPIVEVLRDLVPKGRVLDPFAGTGRIHWLASDATQTVGVEIEPEWATLDPRTIVGDALHLPFEDRSFDGIITSPVYGNRMSDHHDAKDDSRRNTYKHTLGRDLHPNNSGQLHWGPKYRDFHLTAWGEAVRVLKPGGKFVLNISDFIKKGEVVPVSEWHVETLVNVLGLEHEMAYQVETRRQRQGANGHLRVPHEVVWVGRKLAE